MAGTSEANTYLDDDSTLAAPRRKKTSDFVHSGPWSWMAEAACRGMSPEHFTPSHRRNFDAVTATAQAACRRCPVVAECARLALTLERPYGVWAGEVFVGKDDADHRSRLTKLAGATRPASGRRYPCAA